ncbi:MAG: efflux RND transporter permease subunit [Pirellulales bacterium]|nr:efflux RND transporter permease subunit [Pirellulales bacterium]
MRNILIKILPTIIILLSFQTGCKPAAKSTVKITIKYPGASSEGIESSICIPLEHLMRTMEEVESFTGVSSSEICEIYIRGQSTIDADVLKKKVSQQILSLTSLLPAESEISQAVDFSGKTPPSMSDIPKVEKLYVEIDQAKAARLEISLHAISNAVKKGVDSGKPLSEVEVLSENGKSFPLSEIAKFTKGHEPKYRVRHWSATENP